MSITLKPIRPLTDDELLEFSERNPGYQFERNANGELVVTPTGGESGHREAILIGQLTQWAQNDGRGLVFSSSSGFHLPDGSVHVPDVSWLQYRRWNAVPKEQRRKFVPMCPDAVFEIRSESQTAAELQEKMRLYLGNGAHIAVFIDPLEQTVEVYRPGQPPEIHTNPKIVSLDPELTGLVLDLGPIFTT
jgi:Uma2 family endonuclease